MDRLSFTSGQISPRKASKEHSFTVRAALTPALEIDRKYNADLARRINVFSSDHDPRISNHWIGKYENLAASSGMPGVYSADLAKELFSKFRRDKARYAPVVHDASTAIVESAFVRRVRSTHVRRAAREDRPAVGIIGGGCGVGKSTAIAQLRKRPALKDAPLFDGTLSWAPRAFDLVDEVLDSGRQAHVVFVYRDPDEAARGVIQRALETGRTIPSDAFTASHMESPKTVIELARRYGSHPDVHVEVVENLSQPRELRAQSVQFLKSVVSAMPPKEVFLKRTLASFERALNELDANGALVVQQRAMVREGLGLAFAG